MMLLPVAALVAVLVAGPPAPPPPPPPPPPETDRVQTSSDANRESLKGAVTAPLRDLNVTRTKIPQVLLDAITDPYGRPQPANCARIAQLVRPLNQALGADLDEPSTDEDDLLTRGRETALGAVASAASDVIPLRGWVRKLSGAEQHDKLVNAAITAGAVRRGYLKGLGEARGCNPPATPSHLLTGREPVTDGRKPKYPVK